MSFTYTIYIFSTKQHPYKLNKFKSLAEVHSIVKLRAFRALVNNMQQIIYCYSTVGAISICISLQ